MRFLCTNFLMLNLPRFALTHLANYAELSFYFWEEGAGGGYVVHEVSVCVLVCVYF